MTAAVVRRVLGRLRPALLQRWLDRYAQESTIPVAVDDGCTSLTFLARTRTGILFRAGPHDRSAELALGQDRALGPAHFGTFTRLSTAWRVRLPLGPIVDCYAGVLPWRRWRQSSAPFSRASSSSTFSPYATCPQSCPASFGYFRVRPAALRSAVRHHR